MTTELYERTLADFSAKTGLSVHNIKEGIENLSKRADRPLTTADIIEGLNSPDSRIKKELENEVENAALTSFIVEKSIEQNLHLQLIALERENLAKENTTVVPSFATVIKDLIVNFLTPVLRQIEPLIRVLQTLQSGLSTLFKELDIIKNDLIKMEETQRNDFNSALDRMADTNPGLKNPKYQLTEAKQEKIHNIYASPTKSGIARELEVAFTITEVGETTFPKPSEIKALCKDKDAQTGKSLFQIIDESENPIQNKMKELENKTQEVNKKEVAIAKTSSQISENSAHLNIVLKPDFSSARGSDELIEKLEKMYEGVEKCMKGSSIHPSTAFEARLDTMLKNMEPDERENFFNMAANGSTQNDHIASAVNNLYEKYSPDQEVEQKASYRNQ